MILKTIVSSAECSGDMGTGYRAATLGWRWGLPGVEIRSVIVLFFA